MKHRLAGLPLVIALIALGNSPPLLAQETQTLLPTEVAPLHSSVNVGALPPPSLAPPGTPTIEATPFHARDPEGLRRWKEYLRQHPNALPTAPGVITLEPPVPPSPLLAPFPFNQVPELSNEVTVPPTLRPQGGMQLRDLIPENPDALRTAPGATPDTGEEFALDATIAFPSSPQFPGLSNTDNDPYWVWPPDPNLGVGPNHIFQMVNNIGKITLKDGATTLKTIRLDGANGFFQTGGNTGTDPRVIYDARSGRWFATYLDFTASTSRITLAVSINSDPTGWFCLYKFSSTFKQDFPQLGVSDDKVVITYNGIAFDTGKSVGAGFWVIHKQVAMKTDQTQCGPLPSSAYVNVGPILSWHTLQPPQILGTQAPDSLKDLYFAQLAFCDSQGHCNPSTSSISLLKVTGLPDSGGISQQTYSLSIPTLSAPPDAQQQGSSILLDTGDGGLLSAAWQNNSLWVAGNEACNNRSCLRVIEIKSPTPTPQPVCLDGLPAPCINLSRTLEVQGQDSYMPALRPDPDGNLFVVFTGSSATMYPSVQVTGWLASDPGTIQPVGMIRPGEGAQTNSLALRRMGDYSGAAVDPSDPHSVWVMGEYIRSTAQQAGQDWATEVAQIRAVPTVSVSLNQTAFHTGNRLDLGGTVVRGLSPVTADVYVALQLPDASLQFLVVNQYGQVVLSPTLAPIASNWTISAFQAQIFSYTFAGGEPIGNYAWLAALAEPGTLNWIGGIFSLPFSFSP